MSWQSFITFINHQVVSFNAAFFLFCLFPSDIDNTCNEKMHKLVKVVQYKWWMKKNKFFINKSLIIPTFRKITLICNISSLVLRSVLKCLPGISIDDAYITSPVQLPSNYTIYQGHVWWFLTNILLVSITFRCKLCLDEVLWE